MALNQVVWNGVGLLGPALGGIVIARLGVSWAYGIDLVTYGVMFVAVLMIAPMPPGGEGATPGVTGWAAVKEGFSFVRASRLLQSTFAIDLVAMIFGLPRALFPILAVTQFHRGPEVVGLLFSAPAAGALLGALTGGWARHVRHQGMGRDLGGGRPGAPPSSAFGLVGANLPAALRASSRSPAPPT